MQGNQLKFCEFIFFTCKLWDFSVFRQADVNSLKGDLEIASYDCCRA